MTREEHIAEHRRLHRALDQLVADFLRHRCIYGENELKLPSNTTVRELMEWSFQQTIEPTTFESRP